MSTAAPVPEPTIVELRMAKHAGWWWENKLVAATSCRSLASDDAESDARYALVEMLIAWRDDPDLRRRFASRQEMIHIHIRRHTVNVYRTRAGRATLGRELSALRLDEPAGEGYETYADLLTDRSQNTERSALARIDMEAYARGRLQPTSRPRKLSPRMVEVLLLAAEGNSSEEIGAALFITLETVKTHKQRMLKILNATSMTNAVHLAHLRGIFGTAAPRATIAA